MSSELALWDIISLGLTLLFVVVFSIKRIRALLSSSIGGCGNCSSSSSCSAPLTKRRLECQPDAQSVSVDSIHANLSLKREKENKKSTSE